MNNNFIEAEEFLKQPVEVQQGFMDWWQPKIGDIIGIEYEVIGKNLCTQKFWKYECINENDLFNYETKEELINSFIKVNCTGRYYLCLNMSQLVNYIEDNSLCKIDIEYSPRKEKGYRINFYKIVDTEYGERCDFLSKRENLGHNLLQALWKVACKIEKDK